MVTLLQAFKEKNYTFGWIKTISETGKVHVQKNVQLQHSYKKQIVWKHGPILPFYAFMLRTKLY